MTDPDKVIEHLGEAVGELSKALAYADPLDERDHIEQEIRAVYWMMEEIHWETEDAEDGDDAE